jgi:hypothetical protein
MLCPNCGTKTTTTDHKFCRSCGMNLESVSKAMTAHLAQGGTESPPVHRDGERRELRRVATGLATGISVMLIGVLLLSIAKLFGLSPSYRLFGIIGVLLGTFISMMAVLLPLRLAGRPRRTPSPGALEGPRSTGRLLHESTLEPVPSVTERTTDLLGVEVKAVKPQQD